MPSWRAFCRNEPSVLFVSFTILTNGVFAFEWARSSFTSALVYSRRTVFFFAFLAISSSIDLIWWPSSTIAPTNNFGSPSANHLLDGSQLLKHLHTETPSVRKQAIGCLKEAFRSAIKVAIRPIYRIEQRGFLPLLENVISPASIGLILDIDLVISEIGLPPLLAYDSFELRERAVVWPVDNTMKVQSVISAGFQHRQHRKPCSVTFGSASEYCVIKPVAKVPEVL